MRCRKDDCGTTLRQLSLVSCMLVPSTRAHSLECCRLERCHGTHAAFEDCEGNVVLQTGVAMRRTKTAAHCHLHDLHRHRNACQLRNGFYATLIGGSPRGIAHSLQAQISALLSTWPYIVPITHERVQKQRGRGSSNEHFVCRPPTLSSIYRTRKIMEESAPSALAHVYSMAVAKVFSDCEDITYLSDQPP